MLGRRKVRVLAMPASRNQRILVWLAVLAYLIFLIASDWRGLRHGFSTFPPFMATGLFILVIAVARNLYGPPVRRRIWLEVCFWLITAPWIFYLTAAGFRRSSGRRGDFSLVVLDVLMVGWAWTILFPRGKLAKLSSPAVWGGGPGNEAGKQ